MAQVNLWGRRLTNQRQRHIGGNERRHQRQHPLDGRQGRPASRRLPGMSMTGMTPRYINSEANPTRQRTQQSIGRQSSNV